MVSYVIYTIFVSMIPIDNPNMIPSGDTNFEYWFVSEKKLNQILVRII